MPGRRPDASASPWRVPDFRRLWFSQSLGGLGGELSDFALPSAAILLLQADAAAVGVLKALQLLPYLVFGLLVGAISDRAPRRRLMLLAAAGRSAVLASIPLAFMLHSLSLGYLYIAAAAGGTLAVVFTTAAYATLPDLVAPPQLAQANLHLQLSRSASQIAGPGISGLLIQRLGAANAILADAVTHLAAALWTARLRPAPATPAADPRRQAGTLRQIHEGLALVLRSPTIRSIMATNATLNLGVSMAQAVLLLFAYRELRLAPGLVGTLFALGSLGFLAGAATGSRLTRRLGLTPVLALTGTLIGLGVLLLPLAGMGAAAAPVLVGYQFVTSMLFPIYNANQVTLRQRLTPPDLQGRVSATVRTVGMGVIPIGSTLAGLLGLRLGLAPTIVLGGLVATASPLWLLGMRAPEPRPASGRT